MSTTKLRYEDYIGKLSAHSDRQDAILNKLGEFVDRGNAEGDDVELDLPFIIDLFRGQAMFMRPSPDPKAKTGTIVMSGKATFLGTVVTVEEGKDQSKLVWRWPWDHQVPTVSEKITKLLQPIRCVDQEIKHGFPDAIQKLATNSRSSLRKPQILDIIIAHVSDGYDYVAEVTMEENDTIYYIGMSELNWTEENVDSTRMKQLEHYHWQSKYLLGVPLECKYCTDDLEEENIAFYNCGKNETYIGLAGYCKACILEELLPKRYVKAWESIETTDCQKTLKSWLKDGPPVWLEDPAMPVPTSDYIRYIIDAEGDSTLARYAGAPETKSQYAEKRAEFDAFIHQRLEFLQLAGGDDEDAIAAKLATGINEGETMNDDPLSPRVIEEADAASEPLVVIVDH